MDHITYNKKGFLLPNSINSCASFHAKIFQSGEYMFRIHDCNTGIRLRGNLNSQEAIQEAKEKIRSLIDGLKKFEQHIKETYK